MTEIRVSEESEESEESQEEELRIVVFNWVAFLTDAMQALDPFELKMLVYVATETLGIGRLWTRIRLQDLKDGTGFCHPTTLKHLKELRKHKWIKRKKSYYPEGQGFLYSLGDRGLMSQEVIEDDLSRSGAILL